jgi:enterochelin esterase-like enzyme
MAQAHEGWREPCASGRVARLRAALAEGQPHAEAAFWRELEAEGAPIVEPTSDPAAVCVTFFYRGDTALHHVALRGPLVVGLEGFLFDRVPGTDTWHLSLRLPADTLAGYALSPNDSLVPYRDVTDWVDRRRTFTKDPLNPHAFTMPQKPDAPDMPPEDYSMVALGGRARALREPVPPTRSRGSVEELVFRSELLGNDRALWVYRPAAWTADRPWPLLVTLDGWEHRHAYQLPRILDHLIDAGRIPPLVALMPSSGPFALRQREVMFDDAFTSFLADELAPWAIEEHAVSASGADHVVAGASGGGVGALYAACSRPDAFGATLLQSSGCAWPKEGRGGPGWFLDALERGPQLAFRAWIDVGMLELDNLGEIPSLLEANRRLRRILEARGCSVAYRELPSSHDIPAWRESLLEALPTLLSEASP